jgi:hypothetical protein
MKRAKRRVASATTKATRLFQDKWLTEEEAIRKIMLGLECSRERAEEVLDEFERDRPHAVMKEQ